jgi:hypothetical protein
MATPHPTSTPVDQGAARALLAGVDARLGQVTRHTAADTARRVLEQRVRELVAEALPDLLARPRGR